MQLSQSDFLSNLKIITYQVILVSRLAFLLHSKHFSSCKNRKKKNLNIADFMTKNCSYETVF